ncbi:MAG: hypothetical protein U0228_25480 [Myxococcaceae bacterium]
MKISIKPPSLPQVGVDIVKTPAAPAPIPVPFPNVGGSSFTPASGMERRFSVRFMNALPQQLKLAKVPEQLASKLEARFGTMNRSELDVQGRVVEHLMQSQQPAHALGVFEAFSSMHTAILPGGHRVEPNLEGSWTVRPKGGEAFTLEDKAGASAKLPDGTQLQVKAKGLFEAAGQVLDRAAAEFAQAVPPEQLMKATMALNAMLVGIATNNGTAPKAAAEAVNAYADVAGSAARAAGKHAGAAHGVMGPSSAGLATGAKDAALVAVGVASAALAPTAAVVGATAAVVSAALTVVQNTPALMEAGAVLLDAGGLHDAAKSVRQGEGELSKLLQGPGISTVLQLGLCTCAVAVAVGKVGAAPFKLALDHAGRSATPSPRNDPDLERGLLWLKAAKQGGVDGLEAFAKQIRGQSRADLQGILIGL